MELALDGLEARAGNCAAECRRQAEAEADAVRKAKLLEMAARCARVPTNGQTNLIDPLSNEVAQFQEDDPGRNHRPDGGDCEVRKVFQGTEIAGLKSLKCAFQAHELRAMTGLKSEFLRFQARLY